MVIVVVSLQLQDVMIDCCIDTPGWRGWIDRTRYVIMMIITQCVMLCYNRLWLTMEQTVTCLCALIMLCSKFVPRTHPSRACITRLRVFTVLAGVADILSVRSFNPGIWVYTCTTNSSSSNSQSLRHSPPQVTDIPNASKTRSNKSMLGARTARNKRCTSMITNTRTGAYL